MVCGRHARKTRAGARRTGKMTSKEAVILARIFEALTREGLKTR